MAHGELVVSSASHALQVYLLVIKPLKMAHGESVVSFVSHALQVYLLVIQPLILIGSLIHV